MGVASGLVLYLVIWSMTFLVAIPIRIQTQGDVNEIVPGTHAGSPAHHHLRKKALITTCIAAVIWGIAASIILSGAISVRDIDMFNRMGPSASEAHETNE